MQPRLRLSLALVAAALAACVDSQAPDQVRTPDLRKPEATLPSVEIPSLSSSDLKPSFRRGSTQPQRGYNVTLRFLTATSPSQEAAFFNAAARWEHQITKDKPDDSEGLPANYCIIGAPGFPGTIDDLLIDIVVTEIDGPGTPEDGNILGFAGPCAIRTSDLLSVYGVMFFDVFDLGTIEDEGILDEVILHEMGHVLGIGTLWDLDIPGFPVRNLLRGETTINPFFVGKRANKGYKGYGGRGFVPVEGDFGPGTALGHWDEETFGNELMTGFIALGKSPLSDVTAGSLTDLGYEARDKGERYRLPGSGNDDDDDDDDDDDLKMEQSLVSLGRFNLADGEILIKPRFVR